MALDLGLLVVLLAFAWLGAFRGAAEAAIRLVGLAVAYGASLLAGKLVGGSWLAIAGAGIGAFIAVQLGIELAARRVRARNEGEEISDASRALGSLCGVARGGLLLVPLLWLAGFSESVRATGRAPALPDLSGSRSAGVGQQVAGLAATQLAADGERGSRVTAKWIAEPGDAMTAFADVAADSRLRVLQADQGFWSDLENGDVASALARPTFSELARDAELRAKLADLGLVAETSAVDAQQFHEEMTAVMQEIAPRLRELRADPELQALLADDELRARAQAGDTAAVLLDPRVRALVARVSR
ncbi:MAG TPA: CvpA family protein [Myxococcota bacterium]|nr:CvpA family protein [Myxococcota bacterium]